MSQLAIKTPITKQAAPGAIPCGTCEAGHLTAHRGYILGKAVGLIGWILLLPCFVGVVAGLLGLSATLSGAIAIIQVKGAGGLLAGAFLVAAAWAYLAVQSFVGGLLGFLLIRRRDYLQCSTCGAVTPAS